MSKTKTTTTNSNLFLAELLVILEAYHVRKLQKLQEIRSSIVNINPALLEKTVEKLLLVSPNRTDYLTFLTQYVMPCSIHSPASESLVKIFNKTH